MFTPIGEATRKEFFNYLLNGDLFASFQLLFNEKMKTEALGGDQHPDVLKFLLLHYASEVLFRADQYAAKEEGRQRWRKGLNVYSVVAIMLAAKFIFDQLCFGKRVINKAGPLCAILPLNRLFSTYFSKNISMDLAQYFNPFFKTYYLPKKFEDFLGEAAPKPITEFNSEIGLTLAERDLLRLVNHELPVDYASFLDDEELLKVFIRRLYHTSTSAAQDKSFQEAREAIQAMREGREVPAVEEKVLGYPISGMPLAAIPMMFRRGKAKYQFVDERFIQPLWRVRGENPEDGSPPSEGEELDEADRSQLTSR